MKLTLACACLLASLAPAMAQTQAPPDTETLRAAIEALQTQRNNAMDQAASASAEVSLLNKKLQSANAELSQMKAKAAEAEAKKKAEKPEGPAPMSPPAPMKPPAE